MATGPLPVPSYQHLLLQAVQEAVLQLATVTRPQTGAGGTRVPADHVWQVGDVVSYCREVYVVAEITRRALLESELSGSVDIHFASDDLGRLQLVAQALQLRQP